MEILNSGSFVPLDNREKIDQLIFTARTLATEASRAEGFQNSGQTNHQLGLEMWKGAEYVCRAHEEANIRNLFLSKFLERLREIEKERMVHSKPAVASTPPAVTIPAVQPSPAPVSVQSFTPQTVPEQRPQGASQDEYLGVVPTDDQSGCDRPSYADECVPEFEAEIAAMNNGSGPGDLISPAAQSSNVDESVISVTSEDSSAREPVNGAEIEQSESETASVEDEEAPDDIVQQEIKRETEEPVESQPIESIVLAEKEPYNLDACTVTAVIQVLPETSGRRKFVVSLRTHDFAPMVAVSETGSVEVIPHISVALGDVLARYRSDLPAKAAEKLKKEKPTAKKQSKTGSKTATVQSKAAMKSEATPVAPTQNAESDQDQQGLFAS